jgi:hypothetical protein
MLHRPPTRIELTCQHESKKYIHTVKEQLQKKREEKEKESLSSFPPLPHHVINQRIGYKIQHN